MDKILIDSDVILDVLLDRVPFNEHSSQLLSLCENGTIKGFITPIVLSNLYYILRKNVKHEKVINSLKMIVSILDIVVINKLSVIEALNSNFKDFEDALQNFSAENNNEIKIVLTRNINDYKTSKLSIMTPETYLNTLILQKQDRRK